MPAWYDRFFGPGGASGALNATGQAIGHGAGWLGGGLAPSVFPDSAAYYWGNVQPGQQMPGGPIQQSAPVSQGSPQLGDANHPLGPSPILSGNVVNPNLMGQAHGEPLPGPALSPLTQPVGSGTVPGISQAPVDMGQAHANFGQSPGPLSGGIPGGPTPNQLLNQAGGAVAGPNPFQAGFQGGPNGQPSAFRQFLQQTHGIDQYAPMQHIAANWDQLYAPASGPRTSFMQNPWSFGQQGTAPMNEFMGQAAHQFIGGSGQGYQNATQRASALGNLGLGLAGQNLAETGLLGANGIPGSMQTAATNTAHGDPIITGQIAGLGQQLQAGNITAQEYQQAVAALRNNTQVGHAATTMMTGGLPPAPGGPPAANGAVGQPNWNPLSLGASPTAPSTGGATGAGNNNPVIGGVPPALRNSVEPHHFTTLNNMYTAATAAAGSGATPGPAGQPANMSQATPAQVNTAINNVVSQAMAANVPITQLHAFLGHRFTPAAVTNWMQRRYSQFWPWSMSTQDANIVSGYLNALHNSGAPGSQSVHTPNY